MTDGDLDWTTCGPEVSEEDARAVGAALGVDFPAVYVAIARRCPGGHPVPNTFFYEDPQLGRVRTSLAQLLSLEPDATEGVLAITRALAEQLPPEVAAVAADGGGDYVCLDFRGGGAPSVVYFAHENPEGEDVIPLAPSFDAFLRILIPRDS